MQIVMAIYFYLDIFLVFMSWKSLGQVKETRFESDLQGVEADGQ